MVSKTCLIILILLNKSNVFSHEKSLFLRDYIAKLNAPNALELHLCWEKQDILKLQRDFSEIIVRYTVHKTGFINENNDGYYRIFITDMKCYFFDRLVQNALLKELFKFPHKWIIFGNATELKHKKYYFPINSYSIVVEDDNLSNSLKISSIYKVHNMSEYHENVIGLWSPYRGFVLYNELTIIRNRTNFFRMPLRVSYVMLDNNSLVGIEDNRNKHIDKLSTINYLMFEHFVDIWNMTHEKLIRNDWGLEYHPKKLYYKGMLGDLLYGRADIGGTLSFTPPERLKYFRYLLCTIQGLGLLFVFRAPPLPYSTNLFTLPFDTNVWIGCGLVLCTCCLVIWIILKWEGHQEEFVEEMEVYENNPPNFLDVVMMQIGVVCQMDYDYTPKSTAGKIATFSLLLGFSYIYTAFCARIVILLQSTANNLNDVRTLYDAKMEMGVEDTPYNRYYFSRPASRTNEALRTLIYDNKIAPGGSVSNFFTAEAGIKLVQESYFAFHTEKTTASNLIDASFTNEQKCAVRMVDTIFKGDTPHLSCARNSTFIDYFLIGIVRLFETGVHSRENRRKFSKPKCTEKKSTIFVSVGLIEAYFAFVIFTVGVFLSLAIFCLELVVYIYFNHRKEQNKIFVRAAN